MNKLTYYTSMFILFSATCFLGLLFYWYLYPYEPMEMKQPMIVLNKTVLVGKTLVYEAEYNKYTDITPKISRVLVDGVVHALPAIETINSAGYHKQLIYSLVIPNIPSGSYYLKCRACYQMNPVREICVDYQSEEFEVIN